MDDEVHEEIRGRLELRAVEKEEVIVLSEQIGHLSVDDAVGIGDDAALLCLPEDLLERDHGHAPARDQVPEQVARADGRELVAVADEDELAPEPQRPQQMREQQHVHHGHLVHDEDIAVERGVLVMGEGLLRVPVELHLEQTVDGLGLVARQVGDTLRGASRGGGDQHMLAELLEARDDGVERGGLTGAGAAGEDEQAARERRTDGLTLELRVLHAGALLDLVDHVAVVLGIADAELPHDGDALGDGALGVEVFRQIDELALLLNILDQRLVREHGIVDLIEPCLADLEEVLGRLAEAVERGAGMPDARIIPQDVDDARPDPARIVLGDVEVVGEALGLAEAQSHGIAAQEVRVGLGLLGARRAPRTERPHGVARLDAAVGEIADDAPQHEDLLGLGRDLVALGLGHTAHLHEAVGLVLHDVERAGAEGVDDLVGERLADALDDAGGEVAADAVDGVGQLVLAALGLELGPVARVVDERALEDEHLALIDIAQLPACSEHLPVAVQVDHGIAAVGIIEDDGLDRPLDRQCLCHRLTSCVRSVPLKGQHVSIFFIILHF